eukprot:m.561279 g.561279  ORF g.561279 m.561279 type:complete len:255 (-) comp57796_c0_seq2:42-806(-)
MHAVSSSQHDCGACPLVRFELQAPGSSTKRSVLILSLSFPSHFTSSTSCVGNANGSDPRRILVTGTPGEGPLLKLLQGGGRNAIVFDADSAFRPFSPSGPIASPAELKFRRVIHVSIDPLRSIAHMALLLEQQPNADNYLRHRPESPSFDTPVPALTRALYWWLTTTQLLEMYVDEHVRAEDIHQRRSEPALTFLSNLSEIALRNMHNRLSEMASSTWTALAEGDAFMVSLACKIANRQGHACPETFLVSSESR